MEEEEDRQRREGEVKLMIDRRNRMRDAQMRRERRERREQEKRQQPERPVGDLRDGLQRHHKLYVPFGPFFD